MPFDRNLLLAKLASARSDLYAAILGIDETALSAATVEGVRTEPARTVKDILAHLAYWETWTTGQIRTVQNGRSAELPRVDVDGDNARILAQRKSWPLCRVMAELTNAHNALIFQVEQADPSLLDARHPAPWGSVRPARWLEKSVEHDARHAAELAAWRRAAGLDKNRPGPGCVLVPALAAARDELTAWAGLVPDDQRTTRRVCGAWTIRDVLGHVTDWEHYMIQALPPMIAGRLGGAEYGSDLDAWNAQWAAARQGQPCSQVWDELSATRDALLAVVETLSDAALATAAPSRWNLNDTVYGMAIVPFEHDREHAKGVRASLAPAASAD